MAQMKPSPLTSGAAELTTQVSLNLGAARVSKRLPEAAKTAPSRSRLRAAHTLTGKRLHAGVRAATARERVPRQRLALAAFLLAAPLAADESTLTVERIFGDEFKPKEYSARWLEDSPAFTTLEDSTEHKDHKDIVRHEPATGKSRVVVSASELIPADESEPLEIEDYAWSKGLGQVLIYTNSKRVWRRNTRGDYWVLDRSARQLRKLGAAAAPSTLMFAKFSPSGKQVAFLRERDIYVEDLLSGKTKRLTHSTGEDVIHGTGDWVYEEELGLRDGFKWSPDGSLIAYWQINTEGVEKFPLINQTDSLYPKVDWFAYPKVGQTNPICRIAVVNIRDGETTWIQLPGDTRDHYVPKIHWTDNSSQLLVEQLNRLQNTNRLYMADVSTGETSLILTEKDEAWVDVHDELNWIDDGERFTWISERDSWRHIYIASLSGGEPQLVTRGEFDAVELLKVDGDNKHLYFIASPDSAAQRFLYRVDFDGGGLQRITPATASGVHGYEISADSRWAIHTWSTAGHAPESELISLSDHKSIRPLDDNEKLTANLEKLSREPTEFFQVDIGDGIELDAWCMKPPNFDASNKYPLLVYVYGEPAGQTVVDRWGGNRELWHTLLTQRGYVVMSFDNRGAKSPRGRAFRKSVYRQIGIISPKDQAAAVRAVIKQRPYLDPSRVGIWGWSGGGSSSLHAIFKYPDLYQTAISVAPVPNQRYYDTIYQERYMGLPDSNAEAFREGSAINFANQLKGNLLLIHGTADDNVHYQGAELLINELIKHNKQFQFMSYPNRTHSIKEGKNTSRHMFELMTNYLLEHLPPE